MSTGDPTAASGPRSRGPSRGDFAAEGDDLHAIETLLRTYARAVTGKDQPLFESLLLDTSIPFSSTKRAVDAPAGPGRTRNYEAFRVGVFEGPPFEQRFEDVVVRQDGPLAQVSLVFVNTDEVGDRWGWKVMHLLKLDGSWKVASEFYTSHAS